MPRKASNLLTEFEQSLMEVVWAKGEATVGDVVEGLRGRPRPAYNTVQTVLRILEEKGYVRHRLEGRAFVYRAVVDRQAASRNAVRNLVDRFYKRSAALLAVNLLENERLSAGELERIEQMIVKAKKRS
jgi:predicted transcriptional regulator